MNCFTSPQSPFHKYFFAAVATLCLNTGLLTTSPFPTAKNGFIIVFTHASYTSTMKFFTASSVAGADGLYIPAELPIAALPPSIYVFMVCFQQGYRIETS